MAMNKIKFLSEVIVDKDAAPEASGCIRNMWTGVLGQSTDKVKVSEPMPYINTESTPGCGIDPTDYIMVKSGHTIWDHSWEDVYTDDLGSGQSCYRIYIYSLPDSAINEVTIEGARFYSSFCGPADLIDHAGYNSVFPAVKAENGLYVYPCDVSKLEYVCSLDDYSSTGYSGTITLSWPEDVQVSHIIVSTQHNDMEPSYATITYETTLNDVGDDGNVFIEYED